MPGAGICASWQLSCLAQLAASHRLGQMNLGDRYIQCKKEISPEVLAGDGWNRPCLGPSWEHAGLS